MPAAQFGDMESANLVIGVLIGLSVLLLVLAVLAVNSLLATRRELGRINKKLENLTGRVAEQQKAIDAISAQLAERSRDPLGAILDTVKRWKEKGLIPALALLGLKLFRAYLGKRRKALPTSDDTEKTE